VGNNCRSLRLPSRYAPVQPRINPLAKSDFSPTSVAPVRWWKALSPAGLHEDTYFYTASRRQSGDYMPFPVTKEVLDPRTRAFNIYCSPCHSSLGDGKRLYPSRGFSRKPPRITSAAAESAAGYFYDVITNGFGIMSDYSAQVPPRDRWNIVLISARCS